MWKAGGSDRSLPGRPWTYFRLVAGLMPAQGQVAEQQWSQVPSDADSPHIIKPPFTTVANLHATINAVWAGFYPDRNSLGGCTLSYNDLRTIASRFMDKTAKAHVKLIATKMSSTVDKKVDAMLS